MLLLLALHYISKTSPVESSGGRRFRDAVIAIAAGAGVGGLAYAFMLRDVETISEYHLANSYTGGGGTNVVNVILVDFRGYDTYGEIIVLGIAGLTIYALLEALLAGPAGRRLRNTDYSTDRSKDRHPLMMVVATRLMLPIAAMVGIFIFLRGHNEPGGGFVAGLVISIALLMQYMPSGFAWTQARQRIEIPRDDRHRRGDRRADRGRGMACGQAFPDQRLRLRAPAVDRGIRARHRGALRPGRLPDGAGRGDADALLAVAYRALRGETINVEPMDYDPSDRVSQARKEE
jgi:multicomponent K+:H+ antiporter subunit A